jgi:hypothetical protein
VIDVQQTNKEILMKTLVFLSLTLFAMNSFAASTLFCIAEDGTKVTAVESADQTGKLFDIKVSIRGGVKKSYPNAYAAKLEEKNGVIKFLVITDPKEGILVVVKDGSLIDATGSYQVESCEIGM